MELAASMAMFKVSSGEYEIIVEEETVQKAGDLAIKLHDESNHHAKLSSWTSIHAIDSLSEIIGETFYVMTVQLYYRD